MRELGYISLDYTSYNQRRKNKYNVNENIVERFEKTIHVVLSIKQEQQKVYAN